MKAGLVTIHHAYNFGAALQAFATYQALQELGVEVEFIDYDNDTFCQERKLYLPNNGLGNVLRNIRNFVSRKKVLKRISNFEAFYKSFPISTQHYKDANWRLDGLDIIITGSDQTFNLYLTGNKEEMRPFFLKHIDTIKKISYASSMGEHLGSLSGDDKKWLKEAFASFSSISVRENKSADYIERLIGKRPQVVLDPTLLIDGANWGKFIKPSNYERDKYIAFYTVLSDSWVVHFVKELSKRLNLRVIALHSPTRYDIGSHFYYANDIGPCEFLSIIKNAEYVVTTSFHATCFSLQFNKQFLSLILGEGNRLRSLLNSAGLSDRGITMSETNKMDVLFNPIDYKIVEARIQEEKKKSVDYLNNAIFNQ